MKKNAMFASRVVSTEEFIDMSHDAQALYFHLLCDAQTDGELVNALMVVRAKGFTKGNLEELFEHEYLLKCDGKTFIRHNWQNNKYNSKVWASMDSCQPYLNGLLEFEGIEGRSAYRLGDTQVTPSSHPSDTQVSNECGSNDNQQTASSNRSGTEYTCNSNGTQQSYLSNGTQQSYLSNGTQQLESENVGVGVTGEGDSSQDQYDQSHEIHCDWCQTPTYFTGEGGRCVVHCPICGDHIWGTKRPETT